MEKYYLYVAETYSSIEDNNEIEIKHEITQAELNKLNDAFSVCGVYHSITQIKDIVIENGEHFKHFMSLQNLEESRKQGVSPERLIMLANRAVLNYASSIKTYIDMETRLIKKHTTEDALTLFKDLCHTFYDKNMEYRFWSNFRNYIVHCEFPYSVYRESVDNGRAIICTKERLLEFDNWKHSEEDIKMMDEHIDLPSLVDNMSAMIYALYIDFFSYFAEKIADGTIIYGEFCKKYNVAFPIIVKLKDKNHIDSGQLQPLPVKELKAAFDIIKNHPHVNINIVDLL